MFYQATCVLSQATCCIVFCVYQADLFTFQLHGLLDLLIRIFLYEAWKWMQGEAMVLLEGADNDLKAHSEGMQDFLDLFLSGISSQELKKLYMEKDICMLCRYVYRTISMSYGVA